MLFNTNKRIAIQRESFMDKMNARAGHIRDFMDATGEDKEVATMYLEWHNWNYTAALKEYEEDCIAICAAL